MMLRPHKTLRSTFKSTVSTSNLPQDSGVTSQLFRQYPTEVKIKTMATTHFSGTPNRICPLYLNQQLISSFIRASIVRAVCDVASSLLFEVITHDYRASFNT